MHGLIAGLSEALVRYQSIMRSVGHTQNAMNRNLSTSLFDVTHIRLRDANLAKLQCTRNRIAKVRS